MSSVHPPDDESPPGRLLVPQRRQRVDVGRASRGQVASRQGDDGKERGGSAEDHRIERRNPEEKGHVRHDEEGLRYVYAPATARRAARKSALRHLVDTFFDGSAEQTVAALLGGEGARLSEEELERIAKLVTKARKDAG